VCNKLWWEHWPDEDAVGELDGSLGRIGVEHVDVIYAIAASSAPPVAVVVEQVAGLISSGRARAWGTGMWSGEQLAAALDVCEATGTPYPIAAQMRAVSLTTASPPTPTSTRARARRHRVGRRLRPRRRHAERQVRITWAGRAADDTSSVAARGKRIGVQLCALAAQWDVAPTHLAFAYALDHPLLATVLFGATSAEQVRSNVAAVATYESLDANQRAAVVALA
jgi:aryl-alcohol dehydrogenase-like predicted oxidoreductase